MGKSSKKARAKKRKEARTNKAPAAAPTSKTVAVARPRTASSLRTDAVMPPPFSEADYESAVQPVSLQAPGDTSPWSTPGSNGEESGDEHRAARRVSVAVEIHLTSESHFFSGLSGDISEGGVFVSTYRPLSMGSSVDLEFSLPGANAPVKARGEVRWLREHSPHEPRGVGIAFADLADEDRARIHEFCSVRPALYYDVG